MKAAMMDFLQQVQNGQADPVGILSFPSHSTTSPVKEVGSAAADLPLTVPSRIPVSSPGIPAVDTTPLPLHFVPTPTDIIVVPCETTSVLVPSPMSAPSLQPPLRPLSSRELRILNQEELQPHIESMCHGFNLVR